MKNQITNARKINKMRCIAGLSICSVVIILTIVALIINVANIFQDATPHAGLGTLRMYTTISNLIAGVAAFMCMPFQIDGLRRDKYKLPKWIVRVMFVGVLGVAITFMFALTLLSATQGFVLTMFLKSNIFLHTINPILIILLFTLIISDDHIKFHVCFYTMVPLIIYCIVYYIMVFSLGIWDDTYQVNTFIPWPVSLLIVLSTSFGLSLLLRFLHNLNNKHVEKALERYYKESSDYKFDNITDAIAHLAEVEAKFYQEGDDIYIPVDIIKFLSDRYDAARLPLDIQYDIYLERYLGNIHKKGTIE